VSREPAVKTVPGLSLQAFWLIVARGIGFAFTLALPIVLTRIFTENQFGAYKLAFIVVSTVTTLVSFGFANSAFYYLPRMPEHRGAIVLNIVLYHFIAGAIVFLLFILWPEMLGLLLRDRALPRLAPLIGAVIWTWLFGLFLETVATASTDIKWSTLFIIAAQISKTALVIVAAVLFRTVEAVLWAAVFQGILQSAALLWYLRTRFPGYWRHFDRGIASQQFRYAAPFGLQGLLYSVQTDLHNYLVANRFTAAQYAVYAVGTAQLPFTGIVRDSFNAVLIPKVSKLQQEDKREEIRHLLFRAWRKLAAVLLPICAVLLVLGRDFIAVLYTPRYLESYPIFALNLTLLVFAVFVSDAIVRAFAEHRFVFLRIRIVTAVLQIPASIIAMNYMGMIGALFGVLLVTVFERILSLHQVFRLIGFRPSLYRELSGVAGFGLCAIIAGAVSGAFRYWVPMPAAILNLAVGGPLFALSYGGAVVAFGLLNSEERYMINRHTSKFLKMRLFP
jgi:O-antigen/teichoic acid export membrane protein